MIENLMLLPAPREMELTGGEWTLTNQRLILLDGSITELRTAAGRLQAILADRLNLNWETVASKATPPNMISLTLRIDPYKKLVAQGYELVITPTGCLIEAPDASGVFYGVCTLIQIVDQYGVVLPCLKITDWPDFPARGVMLDVSRDKVPTMETLYWLVDMLAGWKINQFQLYTEHTFAYRRHPEVWSKASPMTGQEIMALDDYCHERHIQLVPNQNSFGHMHRWLIYPRYASLSEVSEGFDTPWGHMEGRFSLAAVNPGSLELVFSLYDELLPHFSADMVNVGCDETFDLGQGQSKEAVEKLGAGRVYLDYLLKIYRNIRARGKTMQFWGDIILQHPDLIPELPEDVIALEWGYEADHAFDQHGAQFKAAHIPFYVCPGTSTWNSLVGRTDNALANLLNAAENGLKHGAIGYLNTDWGDNGHWQPLSMSFLGYAAGAAYSWSVEANRSLNITEALNRFAFRDRAGVLGKIAFKLGNLYKVSSFVPPNNSVLPILLQQPLEKLRSYPQAAELKLKDVKAELDRAIEKLPSAKSDRPDAGLILREYNLATRMITHACQRGELAVNPDSSSLPILKKDLLSIIDEFRQVWLARNRPGGLEDSLAYFNPALQDYTDEE